MPYWRPPGSNLEAPGRGQGAIFGRIFYIIYSCQSSKSVQRYSTRCIILWKNNVFLRRRLRTLACVDFGVYLAPFGRVWGGPSLIFGMIFYIIYSCQSSKSVQRDWLYSTRLHWTPHYQPLKVHAWIPTDAAVSP